MAAVGSSDGRMQGYRTRRPLRALVLVVILSTAVGLVWLSVLHQTENGCQNPGPTAAGQTISGRQIPADGLDAVPPAPPQFTRVRVLNANGRPGEATVVDAALAQLGFASTSPANDPQHPGLDLRCYGEIRFGAAGQAAARTLSLAVPCAELVHDVRLDSEIDLALGTKFLALRPNGAARTALLESAGLGRPMQGVSPHGGLAAQSEPSSTAQSATSIAQSAVPVVDPSLLRRARQVRC
ncbi:MAG: envelope integrity protein Cei [Actinomycetota bacterium]|nr:envelope integrity protein Cei [Actinomycetota bacterium]